MRKYLVTYTGGYQYEIEVKTPKEEYEKTLEKYKDSLDEMGVTIKEGEMKCLNNKARS